MSVKDPRDEELEEAYVRGMQRAVEAGDDGSGLDAAGLREVARHAWTRAASFSYWQERGTDDRDDLPAHLVEELTEIWNPYS